MRVTPGVVDLLGRPADPARTAAFEFVIPEEVDPAAEPLLVQSQYPVQFDSGEASRNDLADTLPGGINSLFQGLWTDPVTGLAHARARWLDPVSGSFLSEDPLGDVDSGNLYQFAAWNSLDRMDPSGECVVVGAAVGVVAGWGIAKATGSEYTKTDAAIDAAAGASCGLGFLAKTRSLGKLWGALGSTGRAVARESAEGAIGVGLEATRASLKDEEWDLGELVVGEVAGAGLRQTMRRATRGGDYRNAIADGQRLIDEPPSVTRRPVKFKRWKRGEAIDKPMTDGTAPSWDVVRARYWKNRYAAARRSGEFSRANLARMRKGLAPVDFNPRTGTWQSRELHHVVARHAGGDHSPLNLRELTPDWHAEVDVFRFVEGVPTVRGTR